MDRRSSCLQLRSREKTKGASYIRRSVIGLTAIRFIETLPGIQNAPMQWLDLDLVQTG